MTFEALCSALQSQKSISASASSYQCVQSLSNRQLRPRHVCEIDNHQQILQVWVEHLFKWSGIDLGDNRDRVHDITADGIICRFLTVLRCEVWANLRRIMCVTQEQSLTKTCWTYWLTLSNISWTFAIAISRWSISDNKEAERSSEFLAVARISTFKNSVYYF